MFLNRTNKGGCMYSCLIVSQSESRKSWKTMQEIVEKTLKEFPYKKRLIEGKVYILIENATYEIGWQTTLNLECSGFQVSYGFGDTAEDASENAFQKWKIRNS